MTRVAGATASVGPIPVKANALGRPGTAVAAGGCEGTFEWVQWNKGVIRSSIS